MSFEQRGPGWDEVSVSQAESSHWRMRRDLERAENNVHLRDHLTEHEEIRLATRQHSIVLWKPFIALALALMLLVRATIDGGSLGSTQDVFLWLVLAALLWLLWRWVSWRRNLFVATDRRILKVYGVLSTTVDSMRNQKVTDMRYRRDPIGEVLGYGSITIESAGQEQALHDITFLPFPRENYQELCHVIFGEAPRSGGKKKNRLRRRLEQLSRRTSTAAGTGAGGAHDADDHTVVDHLDRGQREVIERYDESGDSAPRMLYSSRESHTAPTGPIPIYPPGFFGGRDDGEGDIEQDPTRR